ncbi:MAG: MCE family protein [Kineosporiaceae bacterium]|nr:MCE family protein [Aeromicrobium sp.]
MNRLTMATLASAAALTLSGCGMLSNGVYDTPLPGGADLGSDPMVISAEFDDALDLVPQSSVKVDNVAVGQVSKIRLSQDGRSAEVELRVNSDVTLPAGTVARLKQTSLLGEKYVALIRPVKPETGPAVQDGTRLGLAATSEAAQVEQVLGALSLVLNGGDVGQFQEISRELQKISTGRPDDVKAFLGEMNTFVTGLDDRKEAITTALDGLGDLSRTLNADRAKIATALDDLSPGMQVLVDQRKQLVSMLSALDRLASVTVDTLDVSQDDIIADIEALEPILTQLAKSGSDLPNSLQILLTYPFPDSVFGAIKGDYLNIFLTTNFSTLPADCAAIGCVWPQVHGSSQQSSSRYAPAPDSSPLLLPPTTSPMPGIPEPTITVPTTEPTTVPTTPGDSATPPPDDPTPTPTPTPSLTPPATTPTAEEGDG